MRKINDTNIISVFECFSSEVRFNIFRLLCNFGPEGLIAGDIAEKLKLPVNNLSFHLKMLRQAKIISMKQDKLSGRLSCRKLHLETTDRHSQYAWLLVF